MAAKYILKLEKTEKPDDSQTQIKGTEKEHKPRVIRRTLSGAPSISIAMKYANQVLRDEFSKDKFIVLFVKDGDSESEEDRWACSKPIGYKNPIEKEGDE